MLSTPYLMNNSDDPSDVVIRNLRFQIPILNVQDNSFGFGSLELHRKFLLSPGGRGLRRGDNRQTMIHPHPAPLPSRERGLKPIFMLVPADRQG
jgi:hypothetical protein